MPPIVNSLGPITDWLSSRRIGGLSAKYEGFSKASSTAKVHHHLHNVSNGLTQCNGTEVKKCVTTMIRSGNGHEHPIGCSELDTLLGLARHSVPLPEGNSRCVLQASCGSVPQPAGQATSIVFSSLTTYLGLS